MPRVKMIRTRAEVPPGGEAVWDAIVESRGHVVGPFWALLHSPELARRVGDLGHVIRFASALGGVDRELAILTVARVTDCRFEWASHVPLARKAGVREEAIAAIRDRRAPAGLAPVEAEIYTYVESLLRRNRVDAAAFRALEQRLGVRALVELNTTAGYYAMISATLNAFEIEPGAGEDLLPV